MKRSNLSLSGVGYGICQRLILACCGEEGEIPQDALPQTLASPGSPAPCAFAPTHKLCLILACRSLKKAAEARTQLLEFLDRHITDYREANPSSSERLKNFRKNLMIDLLELDLASSASTLDFCDKVTKT